ncbi:MAG TPA: formate dehydrogenase accessory sulfurtransferase FdhD [Desulfatiglandales bacterium]|nr:formate dehydrogenase accessory sulfurtransferase FdhD [Desulfatiglandales bacterium]
MDINRKIYQTYPLARYTENSINRYMQDFIIEEPLHIMVEDRPYSVVMRTPGDEIAHVAGFCLSEGLVESPEDIASITFRSDLDENCVTIRLNDGRKKLVSELLERHGFLSTASCCRCGREMIEDLTKNLKSFDEESEITYQEVLECVEKFFQHQEYYTRTRGTHAVMLFDAGLNIIVKAEDVGRHNAMDKSIGSLFLKDRISDVYLAVTSSRISLEIIQKVARAGIPILISIANPTSMAVELGLKLNMTLVCLDKKSGFIVPCGERRVRPSII